MKKKYTHLLVCLSLLMLLALPAARAQQSDISVQGTVLMEDKKPLVGATVIAADVPGVGTTTDRNGKFSLRVPQGAKLQISFIGYETQTTTNLSNPTVILKETYNDLEAAVVIGFGETKGRNITGAVSTVNPEDIKDLIGGDLASSLRGLVPGLEVNSNGHRPGDASTIVIRNADLNYLGTGYKQIDAVEVITTPLYVIDDYESDEETFNALNPNEIQSITVLKDAAAAVYGVNGARGVILVTTKRGEIGKAKISYQGQFGFSDALKHPKMLDANTYGQMWNAVVRAADRTSTDVNYEEQMFSASELAEMKNLNFDLLDKYWSPASTQRHSISLSGGSDNANYFTNVSYYTEDGNMGRLDYNRWNFRSGLDVKLGKWIKASMSLSGNYGEQESAYSTMAGSGGVNSETDYRILLMNPRYIPDYVNGLPIVRNGVDNSSGTNALQNYNFNEIQNSENYQRQSPMGLNINFSMHHDFGWTGFLKGLTTKVSYSKSVSVTKTNRSIGDFTVYRMIDRVDGQGNSSPQGHLYTGEGLNLDLSNFEKLKLSTGGGAAGGDRGFISRSMGRADSYQLNWTTNYARTFGIHEVSAMFTIVKKEAESEDLFGKRNKPYSFSNGQSITASGSTETNWGRTESGNLSYVGRASYAYNSRYLLDFNIRIDASTKFAPANYWGVFPGVSAGWILSEENWMKSSRLFSFLKLRASFGLMGQDNFQAWAWMNSYGISTSGGPAFGTNPNNETQQNIKINYPPGTGGPAPNPDAHWDKSYKTNVGIDARFLGGRLSVSVDAFYNMNREMFMSYRGTDQYAGTVGAAPGAENFGELDNYGIELEVGWRGKIGRDFEYRISGNSSYGDNKLLVAPWPAGGIYEIGQTRYKERTAPGTWGYDCLGMFRSYQEIAEYFDKNAIQTYLGLKQSDVHPGMLIYRDVRSSERATVDKIKKNPEKYDEWGYEKEPDGIVNDADIVKLVDRGNIYSFNLNFSGSYKRNLTFRGQLAFSWGGYNFVPENARGTQNLVSGATNFEQMQTVNMPSFWKDMFVYEDVYDAQGNLTTPANRNAKYPNLRYTSVNNKTSSFWRISGFSAILRNITIAYNLPHSLLDQFGISSVRLDLTIQNPLTFHNPYPDNFINPLSGYASYPEMRRFSLGVNVSF